MNHKQTGIQRPFSPCHLVPPAYHRRHDEPNQDVGAEHDTECHAQILAVGLVQKAHPSWSHKAETHDAVPEGKEEPRFATTSWLEPKNKGRGRGRLLLLVGCRGIFVQTSKNVRHETETFMGRIVESQTYKHVVVATSTVHLAEFHLLMAGSTASSPNILLQC